MDNESRFTISERRAVLLAPPAAWEPDIERAHRRLQARMAERRPASRRWLALAAAGLLCTALAAIPSTRALAQAIWQRLTVARIEVVKLDFDRLPDEARSLSTRPIQKPGPAQEVASATEAARRCGFVPRLPRPDILPGDPRLSVLGPMSFGTVLRLADLQIALRKAGISDEAPPAEWEGAQLAVQIGPTVNAAWKGDVGLLQGLPAVLSMPAGFDLGSFARMLLRAAGMDRAAAQEFGRRLAASPSLLLGIGGDDKVAIREVKLHTGAATLIEDLDDGGHAERVSVLWSVADRVYILSGAISAERAIAAADSVE